VNPRHLILNLLLGSDSKSLTAREAVVSCALFGVREASTRVALARLGLVGLVETAGRGAYRLGPHAKELAAHVATWRDAEQRLCEWRGGWIAVHVGALGRRDRVALRARERALQLLGLAEFERGLHVRPANLGGGADGVRARLHSLGLEPGAAVFLAQDFDPAHERHARTLWDGRELTRRYRETKRRLDAWLARADRLAPDVAAREAYVLGNDAIRELVFDPLLPAPLVDAAARSAFVDAVVRFDAAGHAVWQRFLATHRSDQPSARDRPALQTTLEATP
ncbi:MAG TPA: PaaX family transcriptional regulator C-terminal domain-containing protein, partial [Ramlibacter sp.]|nr:PaaX family transcriptional regulator C-terminal domain-containing protein [Ramlibacter sp.]